jgi:hypothetical protein
MAGRVRKTIYKKLREQGIVFLKAKLGRMPCIQVFGKAPRSRARAA